MNTCANTEKVKDFTLTNPANNAGQGETIGTYDSGFKIITVYNETNQDIRVTYKGAVDAAVSSFKVPKNGRQFTRVVNGELLKDSLRVIPDADTSGVVIVNLGN